MTALEKLTTSTAWGTVSAVMKDRLAARQWPQVTRRPSLTSRAAWEQLRQRSRAQLRKKKHPPSLTGRPWPKDNRSSKRMWQTFSDSTARLTITLPIRKGSGVMPSNNPNQRSVRPRTIDRREQQKQQPPQKPVKPHQLDKPEKGHPRAIDSHRI